MVIEPESEPLNTEGDEHAQQVVGSFLLYVRAVGMTILHALNIIAANLSEPSKCTMEYANQLNYSWLHQYKS